MNTYLDQRRELRLDKASGHDRRINTRDAILKNIEDKVKRDDVHKFRPRHKRLILNNIYGLQLTWQILMQAGGMILLNQKCYSLRSIHQEAIILGTPMVLAVITQQDCGRCLTNHKI